MKSKKVPLRKCIACGVHKDKRELIRIVKTKEGEFSVDFTGKKNGRGAYICSSQECMEKAMKKNALSRAFEMNVPANVQQALLKEFEDGKK